MQELGWWCSYSEVRGEQFLVSSSAFLVFHCVCLLILYLNSIYLQ